MHIIKTSLILLSTAVEFTIGIFNLHTIKIACELVWIFKALILKIKNSSLKDLSRNNAALFHMLSAQVKKKSCYEYTLFNSNTYFVQHAAHTKLILAFLTSTSSSFACLLSTQFTTLVFEVLVC